MNIDNTFIFITLLVGIGAIQSALENLLLFIKLPNIANYPLNQGILKSKLANGFRYFYNSPGVWILLILRLLLGFLVLLQCYYKEVHFIPILFLLIIDQIAFPRWKFFPVSESPLQRVLLIGIMFHSLFPTEQVSIIILTAISLFLCLAYFASGYKKSESKSWRNGARMINFAEESSFPFKGKHEFWKYFGFLVILFECSFFLGLAFKQLAIVFMIIGFLFHAFLYVRYNYSFFFWTFIACYPAVYFVSVQINELIVTVFFT
ncbi:hypothetical protein [Acidiluteibacter ferrifornacis]|uniref:HTTM domain-containing protein n=1 Tax=Acidiluteibacter ferrifornacis TaxID=2692424 RepID=A0A6N9NJY1_9FLAO|nr:hypothetical protein [Acidiluteibacter ferrifornacis]NBG66169.1 hypothetical protein [Acidiluteibacter ferrifornacis]